MSKALGKQEDDPWRHVGGTAVNEKTRSNAPAASDTGGFDPIGVKAHLQHAIEGLERYPRYLSRWNSEQDIDRLEQALQDQLKIVRAQRAEIAAHKEATKSLLESFLQSSPRANEYWTLLLKQPSSWDEMVHQRQMWDKDFVRAVEQSWKRHGDRNMVIPLPWTSSSTDRTKELVLEAGQLEPIMEQEVPDVYSIPILQPKFCELLKDYLGEFSSYRQTHYNRQAQPQQSSLHTRWIDLDHCGLSWFNDALLYYVAQPLSRHLFTAETADGVLDWRQGYLAAYTTPEKTDLKRPRQGLTAHTDDSEVTLNLSLNGGQFVGGDVALHGLRGTRNEGGFVDAYSPVTGRCLLHPGRYLHQVTELVEGDRMAIILWTRSWSGVRAQTCPCCWLHRRGVEQQSSGPQTTCICGAAWN